MAQFMEIHGICRHGHICSNLVHRGKTKELLETLLSWHIGSWQHRKSWGLISLGNRIYQVDLLIYLHIKNVTKLNLLLNLKCILIVLLLSDWCKGELSLGSDMEPVGFFCLAWQKDWQVAWLHYHTVRINKQHINKKKGATCKKWT